MSDTNCFYCGEPEETDTPTGITIYRCGTLIYPNGSFVTTLICELGRDLRREREAHNNTKRERDEARELHRNALREREATEKEVDAMLERAQKAESERDEARQQIAKLLNKLDQLYRDVELDRLKEGAK